MSATLAIARRELRSLFASPLAWTLLAAALALSTWLFLLGLEGYAQSSARFAGRPGAPGVTELVVAPYLATHTGLLVFLVPLLTMRAICGERRGDTLPLLFSSGASDAAIVLGKYLSALAFLAVLLALLLAPALVLAFATDLDGGRIAAGALGLALLASALAAIGVLASAIAHHPATAALGALATGTILWIVDAGARAQGTTQGLVNWIAMPTHLTAFLRGIVASVDVAYFALVAIACLVLATRRVARLREAG